MLTKKYPAGEFITEYMETLNISDTELSNLSGISRNQIIRIKNGKSDLTIDAAMKIAPHLAVEPTLLVNLQVIYRKWKDKVTFKETHKKIFENLNPSFSDIVDNSSLVSHDHMAFISSPEKYSSALGIHHYKPSKPNITKEYILQKSIGSLATSDYPLNTSKLSSYLYNQISKELENINDLQKSKKFMKKIIKTIGQWGVSANIISTGLKTTIKGMTMTKEEKTLVFVENGKNFYDIMFHLIHELVHVIIPDEKDEQVITSETIKILIDDNEKYIDLIEESLIEDFIEKIEGVNKNIFLQIYYYKHENFNKLKNNKLKWEEKDDLLYSRL